MLTLPIKKQWYDMILSGEKKEEYRDITPYYSSRFLNLWDNDPEKALVEPKEIAFRNGYSAESPTFIASCTLSRCGGKQKWGAAPKRDYFVLKIHNIWISTYPANERTVN